MAAGGHKRKNMLLMMFDTEESRDKLSYFYKEHRRGLLHVAGRYVSDMYLAEDIVEQAFIKADRYLERMSVDNLPASYKYLKKIVVSQCINYLRLNRPVYSLELVMETDDEADSDGGKNDPLEILIREERIDLMIEALCELPEQERDILELFYLTGMKYREIGTFLGMPTSTVGVRLRRAKKHLKSILGGKGLTE